MSEFTRLLRRCNYAFALTVLFAGTLLIIVMIFQFDIAHFIFSPVFFGLVFGVSYLLAPILEKKLKIF